jgi:hypothetical protein
MSSENLKQLKKELVESCPEMACKNSLEFQMRLQWLSEGMLQGMLKHSDQKLQSIKTLLQKGMLQNADAFLVKKDVII